MFYYTYIYLNPMKPGKFTYSDYVTFLYEPFYVGKGKNNRIKDHLHEKNSSNKHKFYTIQKIKRSEKEPIFINLINTSEKCAFCYEIFLISLIGRKDLKEGPLTNMSNGGDGNSGYIPSQEMRIKISLATKGRKLNLTKEERQRRIESMSGNKNPMYGKINPFLNKTHSEESIEKMRKAKLGKMMSIETKNKHKELMDGNKNPMYNKFGFDHPAFGTKRSIECKIKQSEARKLYWKNKKESEKNKCQN